MFIIIAQTTRYIHIPLIRAIYAQLKLLFTTQDRVNSYNSYNNQIDITKIKLSFM